MPFLPVDSHKAAFVPHMASGVNDSFTMIERFLTQTARPPEIHLIPLLGSDWGCGQHLFIEFFYHFGLNKQTK